MSLKFKGVNIDELSKIKEIQEDFKEIYCFIFQRIFKSFEGFKGIIYFWGLVLMINMKQNTIPFFYLLLLILISCGGDTQEEETQQNETKDDDVVVSDNTSTSPYQQIEIEGYSRQSDGHFVPSSQDKIAYVFIQTQRCQGCPRLKSINNYKEEVSLAPEFEKAYTKKVDGKPVYFAGMAVQEDLPIDEERGPALIAEFMNASNDLIISAAIVPADGTQKYKDFETELIKFVQALMKIQS